VRVFYKKQDNQLLSIAGHFNKKELERMRCEGYNVPAKEKKQYNKHGIPVEIKR